MRYFYKKIILMFLVAGFDLSAAELFQNEVLGSVNGDWQRVLSFSEKSFFLKAEGTDLRMAPGTSKFIYMGEGQYHANDDPRTLEALISLKKRFPDRVVLLVGSVLGNISEIQAEANGSEAKLGKLQLEYLSLAQLAFWDDKTNSLFVNCALNEGSESVNPSTTEEKLPIEERVDHLNAWYAELISTVRDSESQLTLQSYAQDTQGVIGSSFNDSSGNLMSPSPSLMNYFKENKVRTIVVGGSPVGQVPVVLPLPNLSIVAVNTSSSPDSAYVRILDGSVEIKGTFNGKQLSGYTPVRRSDADEIAYLGTKIASYSLVGRVEDSDEYIFSRMEKVGNEFKPTYQTLDHADVLYPVVPADDLQWKFGQLGEIFAIGDIHEDIDALKKILLSLKLMEQKEDGLSFVRANVDVVLVGDQIMGIRDGQVLDLLFDLQQKALAAGSRVHLIFGNKDVRPIRNQRTVFARSPDGSESTYFKKVLEWNTILQIGKTLFVHGGFRKWSNYRHAPEVNATMRHALRIANQSFDKDGLNFTSWVLGDGVQGPMENATNLSSAQLQNLLEHYEAERVVHGHMPTGGEIVFYYDGKVIDIDTNISGGTLSALHISADNRVTALNGIGKPRSLDTRPASFAGRIALAISRCINYLKMSGNRLE